MRQEGRGIVGEFIKTQSVGHKKNETVCGRQDRIVAMSNLPVFEAGHQRRREIDIENRIQQNQMDNQTNKK